MIRRLDSRNLRDLKRLYFSSNPLPPAFPTETCYGLLYLELANCRLSTLPKNLPSIMPNLRVLNLNTNFLGDIQAVCGLKRLRRLSVIGSRIQSVPQLCELPELETLDLRGNPVTSSLYPTMIFSNRMLDSSTDAADAERRNLRLLMAPARDTEWQEIDKQFRRSLPDEWYLKRLQYRSDLLQSCPTIQILDCIPLTAKEKQQIQRLRCAS